MFIMFIHNHRLLFVAAKEGVTGCLSKYEILRLDITIAGR